MDLTDLDIGDAEKIHSFLLKDIANNLFPLEQLFHWIDDPDSQEWRGVWYHVVRCGKLCGALTSPATLGRCTGAVVLSSSLCVHFMTDVSYLWLRLQTPTSKGQTGLKQFKIKS